MNSTIKEDESRELTPLEIEAQKWASEHLREHFYMSGLHSRMEAYLAGYSQKQSEGGEMKEKEEREAEFRNLTEGHNDLLKAYEELKLLLKERIIELEREIKGYESIMNRF